VVAVPLALAGCSSAWAQAKSASIYTCIDSNGRRITSDRPILECLDREQQELSSTGLVRRVLPPSYTAEERAQQEAQRKKVDEQRARLAEEKRRDRALLTRYPNQAAHDKERAEALAQIDEVVGAVSKRELALAKQRKEIDTEMEFYQRDPSKAPKWLRSKLEDNQQQVAAQKLFLEQQALEKQRINTRFDLELEKLRQLWGGPSASGGSPTPPR
jgi:hypothetical protein